MMLEVLDVYIQMFRLTLYSLAQKHVSVYMFQSESQTES